MAGLRELRELRELLELQRRRKELQYEDTLHVKLQNRGSFSVSRIISMVYDIEKYRSQNLRFYKIVN